MAEQVRQTNTSEIAQLQSIAQGNSVSSLQTDYLKRQIAIIQSRLSDLRHHYKALQSRILNNLDTATLQGLNADGDIRIKPVQSFDYIELGFPNPTQLLSYEKGKLLENDGVRYVISELERTENEIKDLVVRLKTMKGQLDKINETIKGEKNSQTLQANIHKDKIARKQSQIVFQLYNLHQYYYENTIDNNYKRAYPQDPKILTSLVSVRYQFRCQIQSLLKVFPTLQKVDLKDPGSNDNETILMDLVNTLRAVAANDISTTQLKKNTNNLTSILNDPKLSRGINRKPPPLLPPVQSMRYITPTYAIGVNNFLPKSWSIPLFTKQFDAVLKWWRLKAKDQYVGLPPCPEALPALNENDTNKAEETAQDKVQQAEGAKIYQTNLQKNSK